MRRRVLNGVAALAIGLTPVPASAFMASNSMQVLPDNGGFTVGYLAGRFDPDYWCAAGDYVIRRLGMNPATRVFRLSPPPRKARDGIRFSLDPTDAAPTGLTVLGSKDKGISASLAQVYCTSMQPDFRR